jgi:hypothetical protein
VTKQAFLLLFLMREKLFALPEIRVGHPSHRIRLMGVRLAKKNTVIQPFYTHSQRRMAHGLLKQAEELLQRSSGGTVLNTAFIERLNGTMRERLYQGEHT